MRQQNSCVVEDFILPYSAAYLQIQKWKNYWNRSTFAKVIVKIKVAQFFWLTVYKSLTRPHLDYVISEWRPHYQKDRGPIALHEQVQHRAMISFVRILTLNSFIRSWVDAISITVFSVLAGSDNDMDMFSCDDCLGSLIDLRRALKLSTLAFFNFVTSSFWTLNSSCQ